MRARFDLLDLDLARQDAQQLVPGQEGGVTGVQAFHLVVDKLEPGARGDLVGHLEHRDLIAGLVEDLGGLEAGHAAARDEHALVAQHLRAVDDLRRGADLRQVDPLDRARADRCRARGGDDGIGGERLDGLDRRLRAVSELDAEGLQYGERLLALSA